MVYEESISADAQRDLATLTPSGILKGFYLAGGTGLALHFGHRESIDLDFFRADSFDQDRMLADVMKLGSFSLDLKEIGTLTGKFNATLLSFFHYPYPLLEPTMAWNGIEIASVIDIACMKLDAAATRGSKKDFIDLYYIARTNGYSLKDLLAAFERKYKDIQYNLMHIKKSLVFFDEAEADAMPTMLIPTDWEAVKRFFVEQTPKL